MIWKIALVLGVIGVHGDEAVSEQRVVIHHPKHAAVISQAEDKQENHKDYAWSYPSYEFSYKVKDPHTHDIKGQTEERDGDKVKGDYWLVEPTGRKRIVKYHADDEVGFNAHIDYSKYEHFHNEKEENNQVENGRLNSQEGDQLQEQKNGDNYEVTEDNNNGENENNEGEGKIEMENTDGNIQQEETLNNREENGGNDFKEQNENNNNENQEPVMPESDAIVTLEALNENTESRDNCKCNERRQIAYRSNRNVVKNNNDGGQELASRKKRKNNNRSINVKREDNGEHLKHIKMHEIEKNNNKKSNPSEGKKKSQNDNLNDKKKIQESVNFGNRNNKRKQSRTHEDHKYEEKSQNNTTKNEAIKESEVIDQNDDDHKYQHRILIHHPKAVLPTPKKN